MITYEPYAERIGTMVEDTEMTPRYMSNVTIILVNFYKDDILAFAAT
jgi:hypothetical protein